MFRSCAVFLLILLAACAGICLLLGGCARPHNAQAVRDAQEIGKALAQHGKATGDQVSMELGQRLMPLLAPALDLLAEGEPVRPTLTANEILEAPDLGLAEHEAVAHAAAGETRTYAAMRPAAGGGGLLGLLGDMLPSPWREALLGLGTVWAAVRARQNGGALREVVTGLDEYKRNAGQGLWEKIGGHLATAMSKTTRNKIRSMRGKA
jgi:hypothetical protein